MNNEKLNLGIFFLLLFSLLANAYLAFEVRDINQSIFDTISEESDTEVNCVCESEPCEVVTYNNTKVVYDYSYQYMSPFDWAIRSASRIRPYNLNVYDCSDMSELTEKLLEKSGYRKDKVEYVSVRVNCSAMIDGYRLFEESSCPSGTIGRHAVVRLKNVYVESVLGMVISPSLYQAYGINE